MRNYEALVRALREHSKPEGCDCNACPCYDAEERGYSTCSEELTKKAADAIEELIDDRKALKRLVEKRKSVGKVPFDPKNAESRNAMIELHRIDSLIVDGVVFTFNNDKTSHMPLPEPPKEEKE